MCSHPHTGDATAEKLAGKKDHEKFSELNFLRQNHGLALSPGVATTARRHRITIASKKLLV